MNLALPILPVYVVDLAGSATMIVLAFMAISHARRLVRRAPRDVMWSYLFMLTLALAAFSVSRGVGHIVQIILVSLGWRDVWSRISPVSGAVNTATFIFIAAVTLYYFFVQKAFRQLRQANAKIGEALEEIRRGRDQVILLERHAVADRMAATLAHETRNPLFAIAHFAKSLLREHGHDADMASRLGVIVEESLRLERLIEGILKAKHDAPYLMRRVAVGELFEALEGIVRDKAELAGVARRFAPPSPEAWLMADRESLLSGLGEILMNAVEASARGGAVDIGAKSANDRVVIRITDAGKGIPPAVWPRIFEPCFSTKEFSSGLGLSFAREVIEANRGFLKLSTEAGKGVTATLVFPAADPEEAVPANAAPEAVLGGDAVDKAAGDPGAPSGPGARAEVAATGATDGRRD